ncbi:MAG: hypothetical protein NTZ39_08615 [Methanoregula sp.]|nr:hypothetical protein [Methanoregula sp.]
MAADTYTAREAALLFGASIIVSMIGVFLGIFYLFENIDLSIRITTALLVGVVGIISFFRHSVFYLSDQVRMGWKQEHPEFQLEVGYANLAIGIWAIIVAGFNRGALACGLMLATYGTYLLCTLGLHIRELCAAKDLRHTGHRDRAMTSVISTGIFVALLLFFAAVAFGRAGFVPAFM